MVNALSTRPKSVALVALGVSAGDYVSHVVGNGLSVDFDEIWTVNMGMNIYRHDKLFVMDDLRVQSKLFPSYGEALLNHDRPIITSKAYPEYPMSIDYPIKAVLKAIGDDFFRNTVAYAIGYAMTTNVKHLYLFGCDFFYPNLADREEGAMNAGYLLGLARHFGMMFHLPQSTTLLSANIAASGGRPLYGYAVQPNLKEEENGSTETGVGQNPGLPKSAGENRGRAGQGKPRHQAKARARQSAALHTGRKSIRRGRRRDGRNTGVVLDRGKKDVAASHERMWPQITAADGAAGEDHRFSDTDTTAHQAGKNLDV